MYDLLNVAWKLLQNRQLEGNTTRGMMFNVKLRKPFLKKPIIVRWFKPDREQIKLNANGCTKGNPGEAANNEIIRNHH